MPSFITMFFNFEKLIATGLVKFIYWVGMVVIGLIAVVGLFAILFGSGYFLPVPAILGVVLWPVIIGFYVLFWRFICEMWIVTFGIYERLGKIEQNTAG